MPIARNSAPAIRPSARASDRDPPAPTAMAPGNSVAGFPTRATIPCSWSVEMSTGSPRGSPREARWMPLDRSAIWCGSRVLCAQAK